MKLAGVVAVLAMGMVAWAGNKEQGPKRVLSVCLEPDSDAAMIVRAEATAAQILRQADIRLQWRYDRRCSEARDAIVISLSRNTPESQLPGALAYAREFEGTHIVLFYDRVIKTVIPPTVPYLLGHVLAHEIVHILQRLDHHSSEGVMKARWSGKDYAGMQLGLKLTQQDLDLIEDGMQYRAAVAYDEYNYEPCQAEADRRAVPLGWRTSAGRATSLSERRLRERSGPAPERAGAAGTGFRKRRSGAARPPGGRESAQRFAG